MKLDQLKHGRCEILDVATDGDIPAAWVTGTELKISVHGSNVVVSAEDQVVVSAEGAVQQVLHRILEQPLPRIVRLADVGSSHLRLQINSFAHSHSLDLVLAVDDELFAKAKKVRGKLKGIRDCLKWLTTECILEGEVQRCVLSSGRDEEIGDHFVIHGRSLRVQVKAARGKDGDIWKVVKLTRGHTNPDRHVLHLVEGSFKFVDHTDATRIRVEHRAAMETMRVSADSFMNFWTRYGELEGQQILRAARFIGALSYEHYRPLEDGRFEFQLAATQDRRERIDALSPGDALDVSDTVPAVLVDSSLTWSDATEAGRKPPVVAVFKSESNGTVILEPRQSGGFHPPESGVLSLSLRGDAAQFERRDNARNRVWGEDARMPQLAMLLERLPVRGKATKGWKLPREVRERVFPDNRPTDGQLRAIQLAMETPDVVVIQGPPGTGKTTVIRAVVECLNLKRQGSASGQILVTGYQHVAVENAIGRMLVNGLPAIKLGQQGGGNGLVQVDQRIDTWRTDRVTRLHKHLPELLKDQRWEEVNRLVRSYNLAPTTPRQTIELLKDVVSASAGLVPPVMLDELQSLLYSIQEEATDSERLVDDAELRRCARALRTDQTSWADDGCDTAVRLLAAAKLRHGVLEDAQYRTLRSLCMTSMPTTAELEAAAAIRRSLLLALSRRMALSHTHRPVIRADVAVLLQQVLDSVEGATRLVRQGPDAVVRAYAAELANDAAAVRRSVLAYTPVYGATCQQASGKEASQAKADDLQYDTVIVDEAARANPLDLLIPMSQASSRILLVGDHRQLPHMVDDAILEELAEGMNDESLAEKAERAIQDSLFERMFTDLESRPSRYGNEPEPNRAITLDEQFRMHRLLGDFISSEFYDSKVSSPRPDEDFAHSLEPFSGVPAAWISVPASQGHEDKNGTSKERKAEANVIADSLARMMTSTAGRELTFGVITFYLPQVKLIQKSLLNPGFTEADGGGGIRVSSEFAHRLEIGTVDAFQGREFDVVFLSVVRSNPWPDSTQKEKQRRYGHLMSANRMCVAMSRQKKLLIAVGDPSLLQAPNARAAIKPLARFYDLCAGSGGVVV